MRTREKTLEACLIRINDIHEKKAEIHQKKWVSSPYQQLELDTKKVINSEISDQKKTIHTSFALPEVNYSGQPSLPSEPDSSKIDTSPDSSYFHFLDNPELNDCLFTDSEKQLLDWVDINSNIQLTINQPLNSTTNPTDNNQTSNSPQEVSPLSDLTLLPGTQYNAVCGTSMHNTQLVHTHTPLALTEDMTSQPHIQERTQPSVQPEPHRLLLTDNSASLSITEPLAEQEKKQLQEKIKSINEQLDHAQQENSSLRKNLNQTESLLKKKKMRL
ncbi:hypothetical protein [Endozoicomonas sp.]|uniref:hypothetical protein n=1 Tax=Endozoicomonas sp. TaxID=1892382 RepID=UPI00383A022F